MRCVVGNHRVSRCKHRGRKRDWKQVADPLIAMFHFGVVYRLSNTIFGQVSSNCWTGMVDGMDYWMDYGIQEHCFIAVPQSAVWLLLTNLLIVRSASYCPHSYSRLGSKVMCKFNKLQWTRLYLASSLPSKKETLLKWKGTKEARNGAIYLGSTG